MAEAKRRLAAILAADVAGYSRLMGDDERATLNTLNAYREVFRTHVSDHNGRVVDTAGDSVLAVFDSVVESVQCAVNVQSELDTRNVDLPEKRQMFFRIGVNLGDIIEQEDGTIYGDGVNVAARLESLAEPGGLVISESAHMHLSGKLDVAFVEAGVHAVKNIDRPVRAYAVSISSAPASPTESEPAKSASLSIAVLPLDNLSNDPDQDYFVDGLSEQIIAELARFKDLDVIARNSTFRYKGKSVDVRDVGRDLGANFVLEGSLRKFGNAIRVTVQLLDTRNGKHIWAESFDHDLSKTSAFDIHDEISKRVGSAITPPFGVLARLGFDKVKQQSVDESDPAQVLAITNSYYRTLAAEEHADCRRILEKAVALAPRDATLWALLSYVYRDEHWLSHNELPGAVDRAVDAAQRAVALDPDSDRTRTALTFAYCIGDFGAVVAEAEYVLRLAPSSATRIAQMGYALSLAGEIERGVRLIERGYELDEFLPRWFRLPIVYSHFRDRDHGSAINELERFNMPKFWAVHALSASAYGHAGTMSQAEQALDRLLRLRADFSDEAAIALQRLVLEPDTVKLILEGLQKAGLTVSSVP